MRLVIEKHGKGYTVTELPPHSSMMANILCAATSLSEALDFVSKTMEQQNTVWAMPIDPRTGYPVGSRMVPEGDGA